MYGRVYTTRLINFEPPALEATYTVPDGKRCIVRFMIAHNEGGAGTQFVYLGVHGIYAYRLLLPADLPSQMVQLNLVAYERETVHAVCTPGQIACIVTGYIFDDPEGRPPETKPADPARPPLPAPLPGLSAA